MALLHKDYNIDIDQCEQEIKKNKFTDLTTSYYLISKRKERAGIFRQKYKEELKQMMQSKKKKKEETIPQSQIEQANQTAIDSIIRQSQIQKTQKMIEITMKSDYPNEAIQKGQKNETDKIFESTMKEIIVNSTD